MSFLKVLAGFVIGAICGAALALALSLAAAEIFSISQREGAYAMGVVFFHMPFGALVGGIIGATWAAVRLRRKT
ncbi:MAG: hypothetical protein AB7S92_19490 [Parvibaculaceae bacterium]